MSTSFTTFSMILATLLTKRHQELGIDQSTFFSKSGISSATWSRLMRGQSHFQIEDLRSACQVLNIGMGDLVKAAEEHEDELRKREGIEIASKHDTKKDENVVPALIAGAALLYLLSR